MHPLNRVRGFAFPIGLACLLAQAVTAGDRAAVLPRSSPEQQGIPSSAILAFIEAAEQQVDALHSFMLVRHGTVIAEGWWTPYDAQSPHELYSLSKSFTSTAVGLAMAEGRLSIDDPVLSFFPEEAPSEPVANLKAMRVRDLLCMSTGHDQEAPTAAHQISVKSFLAQPVPFKPGTRFLYNTPATFMLSAIVQKATGQTVLDYLRPRLFEPLGIENPTWGANADGISLGGYGLSVRTEDIARFGQLYLQKGRWQGRSLLPSSWVELATSRQTSNGSNPKSDWDQGYGFQFWRCRHGAYRGDGAFGQYCIVMPGQDAVIAITSGVRDMQAVMNLVWEKLLPAFEPRRLPRNKDAQAKLDSKLKGLLLPPVVGAATTPRAEQILGRRFVFPANTQQLESLRLVAGSAPGELTLVTRWNGRDQTIECGHGAWKRGRLALGPAGDQPMAASGAWTEEGIYTAKLCLYETPFTLTVKLRFEGDQLFHDSESNVAFGPTKKPHLIGRAE